MVTLSGISKLSSAGSILQPVGLTYHNLSRQRRQIQEPKVRRLERWHLHQQQNRKLQPLRCLCEI